VHQLIIQQNSGMSNINVPFGPRIPNNQMVPTMGPGHYEQAESVVIKNVHAIVFDPGCDTFGCGSPTCEQIAGIRISHDNCEQGFTGSI